MGKRINKYPENGTPSEHDLALCWRTSENKVVKTSLGKVADLAGGRWQRWITNEIYLPIPWNAAAQTVAEIIPQPPAAMTLKVLGAGGWPAGVTVQRANGAWVANGGATVVTPGYAIYIDDASESFQATGRLKSGAPPATVTLPAACVHPNVLVVCNPLAGVVGCRAVFRDQEEACPANLRLAVYGAVNPARTWISQGAQDEFLVAPGAPLLLAHPGSGGDLTLAWNHAAWERAGTGGPVAALSATLVAGRDPTAADWATFYPGTIWINRHSQQAFLCVARDEEEEVAVWRVI